MYKGLEVNHQWCKSSAAEQMINEYIRNYITTSITSRSLLRTFSELDIVHKFIQYPQYLPYVTSCNTYFWLPRFSQYIARKGYWCKQCPKCVFLFASYSAYLPKKTVTTMFGANLYTRARLLPYFKSILGIEGFKPLDCVGEPEEMILAMHYARQRGEYNTDIVMKEFERYFPTKFNVKPLEEKVFSVRTASANNAASS
jgi:UDP-N-acetyl-alpha-D-muramoyl-L-alanyl-L-glutamate epimerase